MRKVVFLLIGVVVVFLFFSFIIEKNKRTRIERHYKYLQKTEQFVVKGIKKHLQIKDYKGAIEFISDHLEHHKNDIDYLQLKSKNGYILFEYKKDVTPFHPISFTDTVFYSFDGYLVFNMEGDYDVIYKDVYLFYMGLVGE